MATPPTRVAVLGLGLMGGGMARRLLAAGFSVAVFNRSRAKADALAAAGAQVASTPRAAAAGANVILSMVADDTAARTVWLAPDGALAGAPRGAIAIDSSTVTPGWIRELAAASAGAGLGLLDAPVTGSRSHAAAGELTFLVGGDAAVLERARPVLAAMGEQLGRVGNASSLHAILIAVRPVGKDISLKISVFTGIRIDDAADGPFLCRELRFDPPPRCPISRDHDRTFHRDTQPFQPLIVLWNSVIHIHERPRDISIRRICVIRRKLLVCLIRCGIDLLRGFLKRCRETDRLEQFDRAFFWSREENVKRLHLRLKAEFLELHEDPFGILFVVRRSEMMGTSGKPPHVFAQILLTRD